MRFSEGLGSLVIKSHATNQVKIASDSLEIDSLYLRGKKYLFS